MNLFENVMRKGLVSSLECDCSKPGSIQVYQWCQTFLIYGSILDFSELTWPLVKINLILTIFHLCSTVAWYFEILFRILKLPCGSIGFIVT